MQILVPVKLFISRYRVANGRPFSEFERLLFRSVQDGTGTLEQLCNEFRIPKRVIIEGLITLFRANWVAFSEVGVVATAYGSQASHLEYADNVRQIEERTALLVVERIRGLPTRATRYLTRDALIENGAWSSAVLLDQAMPDICRSVSDSLVRPLLRFGKHEWFDSIIGTTLSGSGQLFSAFSFDPTSRSLSGLPNEWTHLLDPIAEKLGIDRRSINSIQTLHRRRTQDLELDVSNLSEILPSAKSDDLDLLLGTEEHYSFLEAAFESATSFLFILSFVRKDVLLGYASRIAAALERGVDVCIAFGLTYDGECAEILKKISHDATIAGHVGRLFFSKSATESHAKVVLYDSEQLVKGTIGSFNWLYTRRSSTSMNASLVDRGGIGRYLPTQFAADICRRHQELRQFGRQLDRMVNLDRAHMAMSSMKSEPDRKVLLVHDQRHIDLLHYVLKNSGASRTLISSHQVNAPCFDRLCLARSSGLTVEPPLVLFGKSNATDEEMKSIVTKAVDNKLEVHCRKSMHAKAIVQDDLLYVGSYNFLSTDAFEVAPGGTELGVVVRNSELADNLYSYLTTS